MTDAIQKAREALVAAREAMSDSEDFGVFIAVIAKIDAALAALDAETPVTPADVGEEPVVEALEPPAMMQLRQDNGNPAWMQIEALFNRNNCEVPGWRVRDELVSFFVWAQYGKKAATALERVVRERDEAIADIRLFAHHRKKQGDHDTILIEQFKARLESAEAKLAEARKVIEPFAKAAGYGVRMISEREASNLPRDYARAVFASAEQTGWDPWDSARLFIEETK